MPELAELNLSIKSDSARKAAKDLDGLDKAGKKTDKTVDDLNTASDKLDANMDSLTKAIRELATAARAITQAMRGLDSSADRAGDEFSEFDKIIAENDREVRQFVKDIQALDHEMEETAASSDRLNNAQSKVGEGVDRLKRRLIQLISVFAAYRTALSVTDTLAEFETGLVGVAKTANLTQEETSQLGDQLRELSLSFNAPTTELLEIARAAGQVGVTGVANLTAFTETVARLGSATDLAGEEATVTLARLLNVTQESVSQVSTLGSVLTALGNSTAATEREIALMALEVAKAGAAFGISSTEATGLSAAMAAVGVQANLAGSTTFRAFKTIADAAAQGGDHLDELARITGRTTEEFERLATESSADAFEAFIRGLGKARSEGESLTQILETLGLVSVRDAKVILSLANNYELFADKIAEARAEAEDANALIEESDQSNNTLRASITRLGNAIEAVQTDTGGATKALQGFVEVLGQTVLALFRVEQETVQISESARVLASVVEGLALGFSAMITAALIAKLGTFLLGIESITGAMVALRTVMAAHPLLTIGAVVAAAATTFALFRDNTDKVTESMAKAKVEAQEYSRLLERIADLENRGEAATRAGDAAGQAGVLQQEIELLKEAQQRVIELNKARQSALVERSIERDASRFADGAARARREIELFRDSVSLQELQQNIGEAFDIDFSGVARQGFARTTREVDRFGKTTIEVFDDFNGQVVTVDDAIAALKEQITSLNQEIEQTQEAAAAVKEEVKPADLTPFVDVIQQLRFELDSIGKSEVEVEIAEITAHFQELGEETGASKEQVSQLTNEAISLIRETHRLEEAQRDAADAAKEQADAERELEQSLKAQADAQDRAVESVLRRIRLLQREVELAGESRDVVRDQLALERARQSLQAAGVDPSEQEALLGTLKTLQQRRRELAEEEPTAGGTGPAQDDPVAKLRREVEISRELLEIQRSRKDADLALEEQIIRAQGPIEGGATKQQQDLEELIRLQARFRNEIDTTAQAQQDYEERMDSTADTINDSFSAAFASIITGTESVEDAFRQLANELLTLFIRQQVLSPLVSSVNPGGLLAGLFTPGPAAASAHGNAFGPHGIHPFASGGIFGPGMFTFGGGKLGTMGEEGPEAIMPLKRDASGNLGVSVADPGGGSRPVNVTIVARDAESYKRSRVQIGEDINRAVNRRVPRGAR